MKNEISAMTISDNFRRIRKAKGLTQLNAAFMLGYSEKQYRRMECDGVYKIDVINLFSRVMEVPVTELLFEHQN